MRTKFDEIYQSVAEILLLLVAVNKRPPYWIYISGFYFDPFTVIDMWFCTGLPNFVRINRSRQLWRHIDIPRWRPLCRTFTFVWGMVQCYVSEGTSYLHTKWNATMKTNGMILNVIRTVFYEHRPKTVFWRETIGRWTARCENDFLLVPFSSRKSITSTLCAVRLLSVCLYCSLSCHVHILCGND